MAYTSKTIIFDMRFDSDDMGFDSDDMGFDSDEAGLSDLKET